MVAGDSVLENQSTDLLKYLYITAKAMEFAINAEKANDSYQKSPW
jgi:hypothetical protein